MTVLRVAEDSEVFACWSKACAPPPAGKGGSSKGAPGSKKARDRLAKKAARRQVSESKSRMRADKKAASTRGSDVESPKAKARSASPSTKAKVDKAIADWKKSGKAGDQRDEKQTAKMITSRYGTRGTGKGRNVKKAADTKAASKESARELTRKFLSGK